MGKHTNNAGIVQLLILNRPAWAVGATISLVYFALAKLGLSFTTVADNVTLIWPPSGLALFALLVFGRGFWLWVMLGAFTVNITTDASLGACIGIAIGNTLEAVVAFSVLNYFGFNKRLSGVRDVLLLALLAAGLSTMVSASIGAFSLASSAAIPWDTYPYAWLTWWMGDAMGILVFTPLLLSWWYKYPGPVSRARLIEASIMVISVCIVTGVVFAGQNLLFEKPVALAYMTFPFLIWAAMRFGLRGVTTTVMLIGGIILLTIIFEQGLFVTSSSLGSLTLTWLYTNFLAITGIVLSAAIQERQEAEQGMRYLAQHDPLTRLPNRLALIDRVEQAIAHADRNRRKFAVLYIDLDRFKVINDSLGHSRGDEMLAAVSKRLLDCVRKEDTVSRMGGDEFVILIQDVRHTEDVYMVCNKIIASMREPIQVDESTLHNSASIGICLYPNDGDTAEVLLKNADIAMYRAKETGRDNYQFYSSDMNIQAEARLSIENDLRQAVNRNEFVLHYQPQYQMSDGRIKSCEALLRWFKADGQCIDPEVFIPVLEETRQIHEVGAWVIGEACRQLSEWQAMGIDELNMSINLSSQQLFDKNLPQLIEENMQRYALKPGNIELEITESMLVRQDKTVVDVLHKLVQMGIRLAVDDFGTGYSSLSYLHRLSIDTLKIDRSFVKEIPGNENSEAIARAIVGLGKSLQLTLIAEGIENNDQLDFMRELECDYVQGFLLSEPLTAEALAALLQSDQEKTGPKSQFFK